MSTQIALNLGRADHGRRLTHHEFADAVFEEPWRYERVGGSLSVTTPAGHEHSNVAELLLEALFEYKATHPDRIAHVRPDAWVRLDESNERIADIGVYLKSARPKKRIPEVIPDLIFEITSEGYTNLKRDYEEKRSEYEQGGVREYVIVDRFEQRVTVLRRSRGKFVESILGPDDSYSTPLLPGLKIELKAILIAPPEA